MKMAKGNSRSRTAVASACSRSCAGAPPPSESPIEDIFHRLSRHFGPQFWWPAQTPTEVVIGAILTQNTAWTNVERAIAKLREAGCLSFDRLHALSEPELSELIRPAGTYRVKARRLKTFVDALYRDHDGSLAAMLGGPLAQARARLLALHGIGPETADAILLYAGGRPSFVVDAYTLRILRRHHLIDRPKAKDAAYEATRRLFHESLPPDAAMFNEYHALLVQLGKRHCRVRAQCERCPLADLPHDETL